MADASWGGRTLCREGTAAGHMQGTEFGVGGQITTLRFYMDAKIIDLYIKKKKFSPYTFVYNFSKAQRDLCFISFSQHYLVFVFNNTAATGVRVWWSSLQAQSLQAKMFPTISRQQKLSNMCIYYFPQAAIGNSFFKVHVMVSGHNCQLVKRPS